MRTQEQLDRALAELSERSRVASALAAEALGEQWLTEPNQTHVMEGKK